jgi:hypothetical protein
MKRRHPPHVHGYIDQHGKPKFYYRVVGRPKVRLPGLPWSIEFMAAYDEAKNGQAPRPEIGAKRTVAGTVNAGLVSYYQSSAFTGLAKSSQKMRRAELERFRGDHGDKRLQLMHKNALQNILNGKTPAGQRNWKKAIRGFLDHCLALDMIKLDPLVGIKLTKLKTIGHHPWETSECEQFEARHAIGTRARLADVLLLQAGQSKCDVVRMGRQHIRKGMMTMRRQKTGVPFNVEITPRLQEAIDAMPASNHLTFLVTAEGEPFTAAGFGNHFRDLCDAAGLPARCVTRSPQSRCDVLCRAWRDRPSADGAVRLELDLAGTGLHESCESKADGQRGKAAHIRNRNWLTGQRGEPTDGQTIETIRSGK